MSFLPSLFCCPCYQHAGLLVTSTVLGFLRVQFPPCALLPSWASAVFGLCLTGPELRLFQPGYIRDMAPDMSGECVFLSSVSLKQRFEMVGYSSVTAQGFIRQAKNSTPSRCEGRHTPKEKPQSVLASFFYMFVSSPP